MPDCRRASRRPAFPSAPLGLVVSLICVALPSASWAQSGAARAAASARASGDKKADKTGVSLKAALLKSVGKDDGELFGSVLETLADGKSAFHVVAETTVAIQQGTSTGSLTGRTEMRGNYGSAFVSDAQLTVKQGESLIITKTHFVCDGKTLWTYKPTGNTYTVQTFASARKKMSDEVMEASFDLAGLLASEATSGFKNDDSLTDDTTYKVSTGVFRGTACRVLTIADADVSPRNSGEPKGTFRVYVGSDKRLCALQMQLRNKTDGKTMSMTEVIKVMEPFRPAPASQNALFHFSPPAGAKKVERFAEGFGD